MMKAHGIALAGLVLAVPLLMVPAVAQPAPGPSPGLSYVQPLGQAALMQVQERLRQVGAYPGRPDGVWGPDSQAALERFQQRNGLQVTGQLNQATAATLGLNPGDLLAAGPAPSAGAPAADPVSGPLSRAAVRNVQGRLRALGFYRGGVDGLWGAGTQAAIERFQQGRGLQPTGQLNPATAQAMGLDPNNLELPVRQ
ncbi:peptidoglycan-binding domain-containing protein [Roseomonas xinghualingensis]|uniref:peptidoglycan-binding domain-containing protein n=1 Tax=Roseomonas xinghualingensis TaxID=2986475 RepID=UPI0021F180FD|nr:peptidoglycan-binding domain-containing protein [Roseomonas sp. SXEYE001]MCV4206306.1 peptidoglycan-binding protein [Roseomonas sp. SXEYE001]